MPYIEKEQRRKLNSSIDCVAYRINNKGELNYCITRLVHFWVLELIRQDHFSYDNLSKGHNVLQDATAEYYRTVVAPYEDKKRKENGSISELDEEKSDE